MHEGLQTTNFLLLGFSRPDETDTEKQDAVQFKFKSLMGLMEATGLYFGRHRNEPIMYYVRFAIALIFCLGGFYQTAFMSYHLITHLDAPSNVVDIVLLSWMLQFTCSMVFFVYWQYKGSVRRILATVHYPNHSKNYRKIRGTILHCMTLWIVMFIFAGALIVGLVVCHHLDIGVSGVLDLDNYNIFFNPKFKLLSLVITMHGLFVWGVVLTLFVVVNRVVLFELQQFNSELAQVGARGEKQEFVAEQLVEHLMKHIDLARMVQDVDAAFEVYTFVMIGTNIPTTVFSILSLISGFYAGWMNFFLALPGIFFSHIELIGLTAVPAKLHNTICKVESILLNNTRLWYPYNERIYSIIQAFVAHVRQGNLGISVWGFAIVTKPLILTTISLTATYLTLLLQLSPPWQSSFGNGTLVNSF